MKFPTIERFVRGGTRTGLAMVRETGASLLIYELYPLGMRGKTFPSLPAIWTRSSTTRRPVLFIHGVLHNASTFAWIKQRLSILGWRGFGEFNLSTTVHSIPTMAEQTARQVRELMRLHGVDQVDIVSHSMGGLIARYYVQLLGGDGVVANLITLGTPHRGTHLSRYAFLPYLREFSPESPTIKALNGRPVPTSTKVTAVSGKLDILMWPRDCVWWPGVRNIQLNGIGHAGLLFSERVIKIITSQLDDGSASQARELPAIDQTG